MKVNTDPISQITSLEICSNDRWLRVNSTLEIRTDESSVIRNLEGTSLEPNFITLHWEALESVMRYEVKCASSHITSTMSVDGRLSSATVAVLPFAGFQDAYRCCLTAYKNRTLFGLVDFTSTDCLTVNIVSAPSAGTINGGQQLDPAVTYALGGLSGLLIVAIVLVAVGCFCVVLSKRKDQITHPKAM